MWTRRPWKGMNSSFWRLRVLYTRRVIGERIGESVLRVPKEAIGDKLRSRGARFSMDAVEAAGDNLPRPVDSPHRANVPCGPHPRLLPGGARGGRLRRVGHLRRVLRGGRGAPPP